MLRAMKMVSWNVNGIRASAKKGFLEWMASVDAELVFVQETKALEEQLPGEVRSPPDWAGAPLGIATGRGPAKAPSWV